MFNAAISHPKKVLAAWAVVAGLLALLGLGVEGRLHRQDLVVPGTKSAAASELASKHFGDAQNLVVVVEGPQADLKKQTGALAARLDRLPHVDPIGPGAPGAGRELRPKPPRAVVLIRVQRPFEQASHESAPMVRRAVAQQIRPPVR